MKWFIALFALVVLPVLALFLWDTFQAVVRARFISQEEINRAADVLNEQYGARAFEIVNAQEHLYWQNCRYFEQARWRRIRTEIMRRERLKGVHFHPIRKNRHR